MKLPTNTKKIQIKFPKSFNCFMETRCYKATNYNPVLSLWGNENDFNRVLALAKQFNHRFVFEAEDVETGAMFLGSCNDARIPAHKMRVARCNEIICVLWEL